MCHCVLKNKFQIFFLINESFVINYLNKLRTSKIKHTILFFQLNRFFKKNNNLNVIIVCFTKVFCHS